MVATRQPILNDTVPGDDPGYVHYLRLQPARSQWVSRLGEVGTDFLVDELVMAREKIDYLEAAQHHLRDEIATLNAAMTAAGVTLP